MKILQRSKFCLTLSGATPRGRESSTEQLSLHPSSLLFSSQLRRRMLRERVINLKAKVTHGCTSRCTEEGLGFQPSRFCS